MPNEISLEKYLKIPDNVWAFLEWTTGVIRINLSHDEYLKINSNQCEQQEYEETLKHEFYHLLQISTSGYLYFFVTELLVDIIPFWRNAMIEEGKGIDIFKKILLDIPELNEKIKNKFSEIDIENKNGVTTRQIIEGSAFLFQKIYAIKDITPQKYQKELTYYDKDYNNSYEFLSNLIGDKAFTYLPMVSFISLCFIKPHDLFDDICNLLAEKLKDKKEVSLEELLVISESLRGKHYYLGTPIEVEKYQYKRQYFNPFYDRYINLLINYCKQNEINFFSLMCYPSNTLKIWDTEDIVTPLIYNPENIVSPYKDKDEWNVADKKFKTSTMLVLSTLCLIIYKNKATGPKFMKSKLRAR